MAKKQTLKRAYSYVRFSRPEQLKGDSLRRQMEMSTAWCERNGYFLDETIKFHDLGVSGFHGANAVSGKLGVFLSMLERGEVEKGSVLIVESLDRLGRTQVGDALFQFHGILKAGVEIVTLNPEDHFTKESIDDLVKIIVALVIMSRAYEESATKSKRLSKAWEEKRRLARTEKRIVTCLRPDWLDIIDASGRALTDDEITNAVNKNHAGLTFKPKPEAVETIKQIFAWRLDGVGSGTIAKRLNQNGAWNRPNGWHGSYVQKISSDVRVIGLFPLHRMEGGKQVPDGEPVEDYFPKIIDETTFYAVQSKRAAAPTNTGGRTGKLNNLFRHLAVCAYCGGPMVYAANGAQKPNERYLICRDGQRKLTDENGNLKCRPHRILYPELETLIVERCQRLNLDRVLPSSDEFKHEAEESRLLVASIQGKLDIVDQREQGYIDDLDDEEDQEVRKSIRRRMGKLISERAVLQMDLAAAGEKVRNVEAIAGARRNWKAQFASLVEALNSGDLDVRFRAQAQLKQLISKIEVFAKGHRLAYSPKGDDKEQDSADDAAQRDREDLAEVYLAQLHETMPEKFSDRAWKRELNEFLRDLTTRRMSREGRFVRVHFRSGLSSPPKPTRATRAEKAKSKEDKRPLTSARPKDDERIPYIDLVPPGSIASGKFDDDKKRWRLVQPDLQELWNRFEKRKKRKESESRTAERKRQQAEAKASAKAARAAKRRAKTTKSRS